MAANLRRSQCVSMCVCTDLMLLYVLNSQLDGVYVPYIGFDGGSLTRAQVAYSKFVDEVCFLLIMAYILCWEVLVVICSALRGMLRNSWCGVYYTYSYNNFGVKWHPFFLISGLNNATNDRCPVRNESLHDNHSHHFGELRWPVDDKFNSPAFMMTSSNGNIFRVTGHLCGQIPTQRPVTRSFDVFFDLRLNKRLSKQSWGWWLEALSLPLWRHRNVQLSSQIQCKHVWSW